MKKLLVLLVAASMLWGTGTMAMKDMDHGDSGTDHGSGSGTTMEGMEHGTVSEGGTFKHMEMAGEVHAEFQVMNLASMNMQDPEGRTHHVMVTFSKDGQKLDNVVGKVKLISPAGKEQIASLQDFGSGIYAANFTIDQPGKWGVVALFKNGEAQHSVKFWYPYTVE